MPITVPFAWNPTIIKRTVRGQPEQAVFFFAAIQTLAVYVVI
jgi:hypothetical protein